MAPGGGPGIGGVKDTELPVSSPGSGRDRATGEGREGAGLTMLVPSSSVRRC